jgi:prolyl oligopeptidase
MVTAAGNGCTFSFSSLTRSPATYHYVAGATAPRQVTAPQVSVDGAVMQTGTANGIPYKLVCKTEHPEPRPLIIGAYGALNIAWLPAYLFTLPAAWVHLGGVYVHAHLRGGGEYGTDWWQAARRHTKQTTFDDLYAVAEDLIDQGWTTPEQLGVFGASLGALTAAVAATQRPQLFRACVAVMPVLDLLGCRKDPVTMADIVATDLGDPQDPSDVAVLQTYSPYHQVRDGTAYPAVLLDCGASNQSCPAWHSRKMAARLQQATSSRHPVLLRGRPAGHIPDTAPEDVLWREAEQLAFFTEQLGLLLPEVAVGSS